MMMSQKDAATTTSKGATAAQMSSGNIRLPATPGTSGVPRAAGHEVKKTLVEQPSTLEKLRSKAQQHTEKAKAQLAVGLEKAKQGPLRALVEKAGPKTSAFRARSREFREKATTKAKDLGCFTRTRTAALSVQAKTQTRMLSDLASSHLADWWDWEEVRQVGWWAHPLPLALSCALALVVLFLGCSMGSTWPVTLAPHQASTFGGDSVAPLGGFATPQEPPLETTTISHEEREEIAVPSTTTIVLPVEPALSQEQQVMALEYYRWNTKRYMAAKEALQQQDFFRAHQILIGLSNERGALEAGMQWETFGNFSRNGFLADLGTTLVAAGQYDQAVPILANVLPGLPAPATALNALAIAYRHLGDYRSAAGAFQTATQFAPRNPMAWSNLGVMALEIGQLQQADDAFYNAAETFGPGAENDQILMTNVQVLRDRAFGRQPQAAATLELWYEQ